MQGLVMQGTGEAGAGESDENGSDNTTIVPPQEGGGEGAPVEESEEPVDQ